MTMLAEVATSSAIDRVETAIAAFRRGEIVVVVDDNDRENEGDLVLAAVHATPAKLALIVRYTSGIVCTPLPAALAARLRLPPMVQDNEAQYATAFTVSIDLRHGISTGISAEDRCRTILGLVDEKAAAADFVRPGHIFPLIAREGGVLTRPGHTEAAVDLCTLSDLPPVGVICELVNDDGSVMKGDAITGFAATHGLCVVAVVDLIAWRRRLPDGAAP